MATDAGTVFDQGLDVFGDVVDQVPPGAWDRPSPCQGWSALDVLGHLSTAIRFGVALLRGEEPTRPSFDRPGELVTGDPAAFWAETAQAARTALAGADLAQEVDTPLGRRTIADRLAFPAVDLYVHAWDIGRATGTAVEIPDDVIAFAHGYIDPIPADMVRGDKGAFGPEVDPPAGATPTERFIAWTGRRPR